MKPPPQWQTVLLELRNAGTRGVHTFEFRRMFIGNPSQRVAELEARGYVVTHTREKLDGKAIGCRYVLVSSPDIAVTAESAYVDRDLSAWEGAKPTSRLAIFDDSEDAA